MIHQAARAFDDAADAYERGRPSYPSEAVRFLVDTLQITPSSTVVDLAAGTGKLTRLLMPTGARIIAVEPLMGMRARLAGLGENLEVLDGTAEAMPLPDKTADAITVAQAFHWFANAEALHEIRRVLRPQGGLALIWNRRDMTQPIQRAIEEIVSSYRGDVPAHRSGRWRDVFEHADGFTALQEWHVPYDQEVDAERVVDRVVSISFIAALADSDRARVEEQVRALVDVTPRRVVLKHITDVYWCRTA